MKYKLDVSTPSLKTANAAPIPRASPHKTEKRLALREPSSFVLASQSLRIQGESRFWIWRTSATKAFKQYGCRRVTDAKFVDAGTFFL